MKKYILLLCLFALAEISLALYLTFWREHFWDAVANKNQLDFIYQLLIFLGAALGCCFVSGINGYLINIATIKWREILNAKAFAVRKQGAKNVENMRQRIQDDSTKYPDLLLNLIFGTGKAILYIIVFSVSLILAFHWWYLLVLFGYTIVGSIIAAIIARPLIKLNYEQQRAEATYRTTLSLANFNECIGLMFGIAKRTKYLTYFQQFYMQVAVVIPLVIIAPLYFHGVMTVGTLMRFNSLGNTILDNMGYGITNWGSINKLLSCRKRLKEIDIL